MSQDGTRVEIDAFDELARTRANEIALECLVAGIEAAHPERVVAESIDVADGTLSIDAIDGSSGEYDLTDAESVLVVGGGNAAGHVANALSARLAAFVEGAVVTDDPVAADPIEVLPGDHPIPSARGVESTRRVLDLAASAGEDDLVLVPLTGGGSALMPAPVDGVTLEDLTSLTDALLRSGATIGEINAVRKHCSRLKGGGLARVASPATVVGLLFSDVVGDDRSVIASGPISPDPTTYDDARAVLDRYDVDAPAAVRDHLEKGAAGERRETPTADDPVFDRVRTHLLASNRTSIEAAREVAARSGYDPLVLSSRIRGEAREAAKSQVAIAEECRATGEPLDPPAVVLSGGETTVTVGENSGAGGPNAEFALAAALELDDPGIAVASVDTDGVDGPTDAAGGVVDATTVGIDGAIDRTEAASALEANDALPILDRAGAVIRTGPTGTNVNDLRVLVVDDPKRRGE